MSMAPCLLKNSSEGEFQSKTCKSNLMQPLAWTALATEVTKRWPTPLCLYSGFTNISSKSADLPSQVEYV